MTDLQTLLAEIDRLDQEATKGPWEAVGRPYNACVSPVGKIRNLARLGDPLDPEAWKNAEFIALARTALPQLAKALQAVLAKCASMERGVGYRVSGQHDTWDSYHEGMSDMAGYIEETITDVFEDAADRQALDQARAEDDGTRITLDKYLETRDD